METKNETPKTINKEEINKEDTQKEEKPKLNPKFYETRIIVKSLPKKFTTENLEQLYSQFGNITFCQVLHRGKNKSRSRCMGFVGFSTREATLEAIEKTHRTFIQTDRIEVQLAKPVNDPGIQRPWSKYSKESSAYKKRREWSKKWKEIREKKKRKLAEATEKFIKSLEMPKEKEFEEFVKVSKKRTQLENKFWSNDDIINQERNEEELKGEELKKKELKKKKNQKKESKIDSSSDSSEDSTEDSSSDLSEDDEKYPKPKRIKRDEINLNDEERKEKLKEEFLSDILGDKKVEPQTEEDYLKSKQVDEWSSDDEEEVQPSDAKDDHKQDEEVDVLDTGRIFVRNLSHYMNEELMYELFEPFGEIQEIHLPIDKFTKKPKGYGYVTFTIAEHAKEALEVLNRTIVQGRIIHIHPAKERKNKLKEMLDDDSLSYKKKKEIKQKLEANSGKNWNVLFMRSDAVADSIAQQMGVDKSEFLNPNADDQAVKLAIGETELIKQTKSDLEDEGINFGMLSKKGTYKERSKTMIVVKNLQFNTTEDELYKLFSPYGNIARILIPKSKTIALIEFDEPSEARVAFSRLAYKPFKRVPLFLEWAPIGIVDEEKVASKKKKKEIEKTEKEEENESARLFIKNLAFTTNEEKLKPIFEQFGKLKTITISRTSDGKSRGFGFVEYKKLDSAVKAYQSLQNYTIDNRPISIEYSQITKSLPIHDTKSFVDDEGRVVTFKKLVVKNVAFEATKKELYQLFSEYGKVKVIRLPNKVGGGHRGFAFVEFNTAKECHNAYEALKHTHLYGRHLVLEFAADEDSINLQRGKASEQLEKLMKPSKKRKFENI